MKEIEINQEATLLDELLEPKPQKGSLFNAFIVASVIFMALVLVDFSFNLEDVALRDFDWQLTILVLTLPVSGMIFYCIGKRIGWIINGFYYFLVATLSLYTYIKMLFQEKMQFLDRTNWRGVLVLLLTLISSAILSSATIRRFFRVKIALYFIVLFISVSLALILALTILND